MLTLLSRGGPVGQTAIMIGDPFPCAEVAAVDVLEELGSSIVCANDPPWTSFRRAHGARLRETWRVVSARDMDLHHLEAVAADLRTDARVGDSTVVGFGGGTALDTAKFLAWRLERPLVQILTLTSVDAGFTDAVGVRDAGRVRYIGQVRPDLVVLDLVLIRGAPVALNRAGIGDILSCHTGLCDWRLAADAGHGPPWDDDLAALGADLLDELEAASADIAAVTDGGVRFLADAYRRIGAACAWAGHSRFEEGSEHFWAYAYEHRTGARLLHGELIALAVCALAHVQGNDPSRARRIVSDSMARAHPEDLGIDEVPFRGCLRDLGAYARAEDLDVSVADLRPITESQIDAAWAFVNTLPRAVVP